jgi:hypothetical protein
MRQAESKRILTLALIVSGCILAFVSFYACDLWTKYVVNAVLATILDVTGIMCCVFALCMTKGKDRILPIMGLLFVLTMVSGHALTLVTMLQK